MFRVKDRPDRRGRVANSDLFKLPGRGRKDRALETDPGRISPILSKASHRTDSSQTSGLESFRARVFIKGVV